MVDIKTTRTYEKRDGVVYSVRIDEWNNSRDKPMRQVLEEPVSYEEAKEVVETLYDKQREESFGKYEELKTQFEELDSKYNEFKDTEEFSKFKEWLDSEEAKTNFNNLSIEKDYNKIKGQLKEVERVLNDIDSWKQQMIEIKEEFENE